MLCNCWVVLFFGGRGSSKTRLTMRVKGAYRAGASPDDEAPPGANSSLRTPRTGSKVLLRPLGKPRVPARGRKAGRSRASGPGAPTVVPNPRPARSSCRLAPRTALAVTAAGLPKAPNCPSASRPVPALTAALQTHMHKHERGPGPGAAPTLIPGKAAASAFSAGRAEAIVWPVRGSSTAGTLGAPARPRRTHYVQQQLGGALEAEPLPLLKVSQRSRCSPRSSSDAVSAAAEAGAMAAPAAAPGACFLHRRRPSLGRRLPRRRPAPAPAWAAGRRARGRH